MHGTFVGRSRISKNWLFAPPLRRAPAWAVTIASIAIPTLIRLDMTPGVDDQTCTIFCPFVLATSILCGWRYAAVVTVATAIACNTLLMGVPYKFHFTRAEIEGIGTYVAYSAFLITVVGLFRAAASRSLRQAGAKGNEKGVVFSLDGGEAWASWYGVEAPVRLGPRDQVVQMMEDFIKQVELGKKFERNGSTRQAD